MRARVTNIIYKQLEIVEDAASKLLIRTDSLTAYQAEGAIHYIALQHSEQSLQSRGLSEFARETATLAHVRAVVKSLEVCGRLIDQKRPEEELKDGESVLMLDDQTRQSLHQLLAFNLDAHKLHSYFGKLEAFHKDEWIKSGSPGLGRFHLDQIIDGRRLLMRSASPGIAVLHRIRSDGKSRRKDASVNG